MLGEKASHFGILGAQRPAYLLILLGGIACGSPSVDTGAPHAHAAPDTIGLSELTRLDLLPRFKRSVGDLFGYSFGEPAMRSLVAGTAEDTNYLYLPMPFDQSARIELVSERAIEVHAEVSGQTCHARRPRVVSMHSGGVRIRPPLSRT